MLLQPTVTRAIKSITSQPPPNFFPTATLNAARAVSADGLAKIVPAFLPLDALRGGAAEGAFNMVLAKTRLEGLAYSAVTSSLMIAAIVLYTFTPKKIQTVPEFNDANRSRDRILIRNNLVKVFVTSLSISVACAAYTTVVFSLISIYSKTALGMGLSSQYLKFFDGCARYRQMAFRTFITALWSFDLSWALAIILQYDGKDRWLVFIPSFFIVTYGLYHLSSIVRIAGTIIFSAM